MSKWIVFLAVCIAGAVGVRAGRLFVLASSQSGISSGVLPSAPITDPITISCWVRCSTTNNNMAIVCIQSNNVAPGVFSRRLLGVVGSSGFSGQWTIDATDTITRVLGNPIVPGQLYHVAAVFTSATSRGLYVDGALQGSDTDAPTSSFQGHIALIGMRFTTAFSYGQFFDGTIAEVAIWNVALSQAQILAIAKGRDPRAVSSTQPLVYWPMYGDGSEEMGWNYNPSLTLSNSPARTNHPIISR